MGDHLAGIPALPAPGTGHDDDDTKITMRATRHRAQPP
jgi:hypothetical protein